jgi:REP element-mobilizing transposase RayT
MTACLQDHRPLFIYPDIVDRFRLFLDWARTKNDCVVLLYCFMPDHLHVIFQGESDRSDIYQTMLDFKQKTGFYLWHSLYHWQKDFYDRIIRCDRELADQLRYVADNPVRKALVSHWSQYPFTGALGIDLHDVMEAML